MKDNKILCAEASSYVVVMPEAAKNSELRAAKRIAAMLGISQDAVITDAADAAELEVLVGATKRTQTVTERFEFAISAVGKRIEIVAGSCFAYEYALDFCREKLCELISGEVEGELYREDVTPKIRATNDTALLGKVGTFRFLYHNVWGWANAPESQGWEPGNNSAAEQRSRIMAEAYLELAPDVICLQEYTSFMMRSCEDNAISLLEQNGYAEVKVPAVDKIDTATPIIYRKETMTLLESGVHKFTFGGGHDKFITWAVFESVRPKRKFAIMSAHLAYEGGEFGDTFRLSQVPILINYAEQLRDKHRCRVFFGGDLNCPGFSAPYRLILTMGAVDTWPRSQISEDCETILDLYPSFDKETGLVINENTTNRTRTYMGLGIDHIFYLPRSTSPIFKRFDIINDKYICTASDHCPVVLDFDF